MEQRLIKLLETIIANTKESIIETDAENTGMQYYRRGQLKAYQYILEDIIPLAAGENVRFE